MENKKEEIYLDLSECSSEEVPISKEVLQVENANFVKYISNQRNEFSKFIRQNYTVSEHLKLRTEIDSLLIAYDQMTERIKSNN